MNLFYPTILAVYEMNMKALAIWDWMVYFERAGLIQSLNVSVLKSSESGKPEDFVLGLSCDDEPWLVHKRLEVVGRSTD